jgi:hypothetical protein
MNELERLQEQVAILQEMLISAYKRLAEQEEILYMQDGLLRATQPELGKGMVN